METGIVAAAVHRVMIWFLLRAAEKVWLSIPGWEKDLRPYLPAGVAVECLPVVNNIPLANLTVISGLREKYAAPGEWLIGHFGTYSPLVTRSLDAILPALAKGTMPLRFLLIGLSSGEYRDRIVREFPEMESRVTATGPLPEWELSRHLQICDLMIQPYLDGISARRSSAMAALAHGLPLVTTSGKATEDLWPASGAVSLAPVGDTERVLRGRGRTPGPNPLSEFPAGWLRGGFIVDTRYRAQHRKTARDPLR